MACAERARLWALSAGQVASAERAALEAHLGCCERCSRDLEGVRDTRELLILASAVAPRVEPHKARDRVRSAANDVDEPGPPVVGQGAWREHRRPLWALSALALAGAVAAAGALLALRMPPRTTVRSPEGGLLPSLVVAGDEGAVVLVDGAPRALRAGASVPPGAHLKTSKRGRVVLQLPDGSRIRVAASSDLWLRRSAIDEEVLALVRGRVAILVSHAVRKQFLLEARGASFRAVGTAFSVELAERQVVLAVAEGEVLLDPGNGERSRVGTGQRLALQAAGSPMDRSRPSASDEADFDELGVPLGSPGASLPAAAPNSPPSEGSAAASGPSDPPLAEPLGATTSLPPSIAQNRPLGREESIGRRDCGPSLEELPEYPERSGEHAVHEWARILRARCLDDLHRAVEADAEYRRYLREFPAGRWAAEARRAVAH